MPLYGIKCQVCEHESEVFRSIANYDNLPECCGVKMQRVISAPSVVTDIQPYKSQITGEMIESRSAHRAHLKQHGCIEVGNETKAIMTRPKPKLDGNLKKQIVEAMYQTGVKKV